VSILCHISCDMMYDVLTMLTTVQELFDAFSQAAVLNPDPDFDGRHKRV
jgi:hypothetical protein